MCRTEARAGYFKIQVELMAKHSVDWLELVVFRYSHNSPGQYCEVGTKPRFKTTTLAIPLAKRSAHPRHTHVAWPRSRLVCLRGLCSHPEFFPEAYHEFCERLSRSFLSASVERLVPRLSEFNGDTAHRVRHRNGALWLKVRFMPDLGNATQRALSEFLAHPGYRAILLQAMREVPDVRITFYRTLPNFGERLARASCR